MDKGGESWCSCYPSISPVATEIWKPVNLGEKFEAKILAIPPPTKNGHAEPRQERSKAAKTPGFRVVPCPCLPPQLVQVKVSIEIKPSIGRSIASKTALHRARSRSGMRQSATSRARAGRGMRHPPFLKRRRTNQNNAPRHRPKNTKTEGDQQKGRKPKKLRKPKNASRAFPPPFQLV